ncbi:MAG: hypothetical protein PHN72_03950 [Bacilli bacterium]|nr:hypothetical protein [Bacilli bacterium]
MVQLVIKLGNKTKIVYLDEKKECKPGSKDTLTHNHKNQDR